MIDLVSSDDEQPAPKRKRQHQAATGSGSGSDSSSLLASLHRERVARHGEPRAPQQQQPSQQPQQPQQPSVQQRVSRDRRIHWHPSEAVDDFTRLVKPTSVSLRIAEWIEAHNAVAGSPGYGSPDGQYNVARYAPMLAQRLKEVQEVQASSSTIKLANDRLKVTQADCVERLLGVATAERDTSGKWMYLVKPDAVDAAWAVVARATVCGELGCGAKVAPAGGAPVDKQLLICVYMRDFSDRNEVRRVLSRLQVLLPKGGEIPVVPIGFKTDIFTELGIEGGNPWKLKATTYSVEEVEKW